MKVELEKLESYEGIAVKTLLDSGVTGLFMDTTFAKEKGFKIEKLKKPLLVRNVDGMANAEGAITHQVEYNIFFKRHTMHTTTIKGSLVESRVRKVGKSQRSSSEGTTGQWGNRSVHRHDLCKGKEV